MAIKKGNDGVVKAGGVAVAEITAWAYEEAVGVIEKPAAMGDTEAVYLSDGRKTGTGTVEFLFDPADVPQGTFVSGASLALELHEAGEAVGSVKHTGTVLIGSMSKSGGGSDLLARSASFSGVLIEGLN